MLHGIELQMKYFSGAKGLFLIERKILFFFLYVCMYAVGKETTEQNTELGQKRQSKEVH